MRLEKSDVFIYVILTAKSADFFAAGKGRNPSASLELKAAYDTELAGEVLAGKSVLSGISYMTIRQDLSQLS